ncbi:uncharacterized protein LOC101452468 isoform X2 [Ceratitis capitata]|uniref:(Mediterranean fruit fly) hypothetical protein n=1 Tax=Ceratitis capitata TaxID=7213 RepID=W8C2B0_CERCA|nr:uncharacterized protein LOC101452468 isoform X2 [Ceratitis capitata]CAD7013739.1 unnamed protein product [Ceratitis capitata]
MSAKPRKQTGSFVTDPSAINLIQLSPRTELFQNERSPYTMAIHSSKMNFIGDTVMHEGPRAVAVSETGEKHSIHLEEDSLQTSLNPFTGSSQCSQVHSMPINVASSTKISGCGNECSRLITTKRSKGSRRHSNQKMRPIFTPRNIDKIPTRFFSDESKAKAVLPHTNAQTQTESVTSSSALAPRPYQPSPLVPPLQLPRRYVGRETIGDMLDSPRRQPLRVLPREKKPFKNYSELRSIASAITLITVVSWLFSIFFELEGMFDMLGGILRLLTNWYNKEELPMTKMEMLVQFARNLW